MKCAIQIHLTWLDLTWISCWFFSICHIVSLWFTYLAAADQWDWGWACQCHNWCLLLTTCPAWPSGQHCTQSAGQHCEEVASFQPWGSSDNPWPMGSQLHTAVQRERTGQMRCWGEELQGGGGRAAEAEFGCSVNVEGVGMLVEVGLVNKWCCS